MVTCASAISDEVESGDWLIAGGVLGVENAPVDALCNDSKISCSSFGSRGGAGPPKLKGLDEGDFSSLLSATEVLRGRMAT